MTTDVAMALPARACHYNGRYGVIVDLDGPDRVTIRLYTETPPASVAEDLHILSRVETDDPITVSTADVRLLDARGLHLAALEGWPSDLSVITDRHPELLAGDGEPFPVAAAAIKGGSA